MKTTWDQKFLILSVEIANLWSKDESTKVGCVIVGPNREIRTTGYNGMPRGVNDDVPARHARPDKYKWFEHAERNAIYNAARMGNALDGCTLYCTLPSCDNCCRAIIQSGIVRAVFIPAPTDFERWKDSFEVGSIMLGEAGIRVDYISDGV